ncbi:hypothetical protein GCM10010967_18570 [Dyadobacter beijingensis]|uniref:Uncharacterized protein n=1 Tax=Dyadobacter beijingensis TaxID=365489 RepID=A0ABQ2HQV0_9BACT|nr:hypothetical protein [Dyadobacter beijingensis]GGM86548.1 hypothetical protein GCM10010967_18570 [Dyadobacter beijingensis]
MMPFIKLTGEFDETLVVSVEKILYYMGYSHGCTIWLATSVSLRVKECEEDLKRLIEEAYMQTA